MTKKCNEKIQVKGVRKLTDFSHLNLYCREYTDRSGAEKKWIFASRCPRAERLNQVKKKADAVVIVPIHTQTDCLVMIREYRVALEGYQIGFPAGLVDKKEDIETTAARELSEETGLTLTRVLRKSRPVYSSSGLTDESVCLVFAECSGKPDTGKNEASEQIEVMLLSVKDARELVSDKQVMFDVKTWIVLEHFAQTGTI